MRLFPASPGHLGARRASSAFASWPRLRTPSSTPSQFLVRYLEQDELVILTDNNHDDSGSDAGSSHCSLDGNTVSIRRMVPAELAARTSLDRKLAPYAAIQYREPRPYLADALPMRSRRLWRRVGSAAVPFVPRIRCPLKELAERAGTKRRTC